MLYYPGGQEEDEEREAREEMDARLDAVFGALAHRTRRGMIAELSMHAGTVGALGDPYGIAKSAASRHVQALERAGLVIGHKMGRRHRCRLDPDSLKEAEEWIRVHRRRWEETFRFGSR